MAEVKLGAVIYAPRVTVIWGIIADFFAEQGMEIEPVFFEDYRSQVDALMAGEIDIAWNSPLAWLDAQIRTEGTQLNGSMRDTDRDRSTHLVVRKDAGIAGVEDLRGKTIGFGAIDSPQARLIPINFLHTHGLEYGKDYVDQRFDVGVGLHGDHVGGELDAAQAMMAGTVDASWMLDLNYDAWVADGTLDAGQVEIVATTPLFDHCIFSGRPGLNPATFARYNEILCRMDYANPEHQEMMDMEGLKAWVGPRTSGFAQITAANEYLDFFKTFYV
jgi:ABC-type phosphate/phosphonate transport system substrate-binding protein